MSTSPLDLPEITGNSGHTISPSLEDFKDEIIDIRRSGETIDKLIEYLYERGIQISKRVLFRRLKTLGIRRQTNEPTTDFLIDRVKSLYQHSLLSNEAITAKIAE
jgi:hypothetical protein